MLPNPYAWALGAASVAVAGAIAWNFTPWVGPHAVIKGLRADVATAEKSAADWKERAGGWEASFRQAETLRQEETSRAVVAVNEATQACDVRVVEARRAASAIRTIVKKEPTRDSQGCPVRELVPADRLREALQPATR